MLRKVTKSFRLYNSLSIFACIVFLFSGVCPSMAALPRENETDSLALLAFKNSITEDPFAIFSSWNSSVHYCAWVGVYCSKRHPGRVTVLKLQDKKLRGRISPHLGNLSLLRKISLSKNRIQGLIPQELGFLPRLEYLNLNYNTLGGKIPSNLSRCSNLQVIALASNKLVGEIPQELSYLVTKKLSTLYVHTNYLTGSIPPWLGNSSSLLKLSMVNNYIQGSIPIELGRLSNLQDLLISGNNLSGVVPLPIYNLSTLVLLDMGFNHLFGRIPQDIGLTLPKLEFLSVCRNHFTGLVPVSLANLSRLETLDFDTNEFSGTLSPILGHLKALSFLIIAQNLLETTETEGFSFLASLTNCSNLQTLDLSHNRLKGELPTSIANFSNALWWLNLGSNNISGTIPRGIENLIGLGYLGTQGNSITGKIPASIGKLQRLEDIRLSENKISGEIPASLGNLTRLCILDLHSNGLGGSLPNVLGNSSKLNALDLSNNKFTGIIPREVANLSFIFGLSLAQNSFTGPLPIEFGNMDKLVQLDVSKNRLSGEIPSTISKLLMVEELYLEDNIFEGNIPLVLNTLKSLQRLDMSCNNLSGPIPKYFENFTLLRYLNLSFNSLEGEVPQEGIFRNQTAYAVDGNKNLCGGIKSLGLPTCDIPISHKQRAYHTIKIVILVAISCLIVLTCPIGCFYWKKRSGGNPLTMLLEGENFRKISYAELLKATNGFSPSNLLGEGYHGSVYKGILGSDGMVVAVKVLHLAQKGAAKSFVSECNALRNIRHRNLLKIITICSSIDFKGEEFKALVFEFMPNGSLEEWLHQVNDFEGGHNRSLNLSQRLSIAIDIASALEYLHHHCHRAIAHGDLKPSNILIDHDLTARVGDFGLARLLSNGLPTHSQNQTSSTSGLARLLSNGLPTHSQNQTSSTRIKGTVGYVAPEYGLGSRASLQGDVYSFGILLLEMFIGKRPTDNLFDESLNLHQFTKTALPDRVMEIVEPSVLMEGEDGNGVGTNKTKELLIEVLKVGVQCSMESPGERMDIRHVVAEMHKIKNRFFSIRT